MRTLNKEELKFIGKRVSDSKSRAKKKNIPHDVTKDDVAQMYMQSGGRCPYIKVPFILEKGNRYNISLDRIDSSKGYTKDNIMIICDWANKAKGTCTPAEFLELCERVAS